MTKKFQKMVKKSVSRQCFILLFGFARSGQVEMGTSAPTEGYYTKQIQLIVATRAEKYVWKVSLCRIDKANLEELL